MSEQPPPAQALADAFTRFAPPVPLSANYCAERAAAAIDRAEGHPTDADVLLECARHWRELGIALASHLAMNRPRDPDHDAGRSRR